MNDGQFVIPILNQENNIIGWGRGDILIPNAMYFKESGIDLRFLRYINGTVVEISDEDKAAIIAADELEKQRIADETTARLEAERLEAERLAEEAANAPFEVSRMKLYAYFESIGAGDAFIAFIKADPKKEFMWFSSTVLDSNHPMVVAAMDSITSILPEGVTGIDLLRQCKI